MPGVDGLAYSGGRYLVGGSRNRARPFIIDLQSRKLTLLPPVATGPRASGLAEAADGAVWMAAGVGEVGLYRIDPVAGTVEHRGVLRTAEARCHHIHDLAFTPDGRLWAGEFYPLDVPEPAPPARPCREWEIEL